MKVSAMHEKPEYQTRMFTPAQCQQFDSNIGNVLYGAGSDLIKSELGAYGEKILGSSSEYLQWNQISRYLSNPSYYFEVNEEYVKNKLKVVLFSFLHKGHWMRATEVTNGQLSYKTPVHDINAPDLYIPLMAYATYVVLAGFFLGIHGKFSPEALGVQFSTGLLCWLFQILLLEGTLHSLGSGDIPLLDIVAYGGYTFVAASVILLARIICDYTFYVVTTWECFCMGVFLVKTMKRILVAEVRIVENQPIKRNYLLLLVAFSQIPMLFWLGNVSVGAK